MKDNIIEAIIYIVVMMVIFASLFGIIRLLSKIDEKRCIENGGTYIWEWSAYGNKCHLRGDKE